MSHPTWHPPQLRPAVFVVSGLLFLCANPAVLGQARLSLAERAAPKRIDVADLPDGFSEKIVATGLTGATALAVAPDGRVFVCEQTGALRVVKDDVLLHRPFVEVSVDSYWERGLLGVALDPLFPAKPYVYLCYVAPEPYPHHRVSRFTARGDVAEPGSEVILLEGDDQTKLGGRVPAGHQGGGVHFGADGKLYVGIGEQTAGLPSQRLDTAQGKLLRINPDGSIPPDNPFFATAVGKYRAIWATGLRNPFCFAIQPGTGRIFANDVGEARWEEINEVVAGGNYGWPHAEGISRDSRFRNPVHVYDRSLGKSISGGTFYNPAVRQFPPEYVGKYFFAEFIDNWIRVLDPDRPTDVQVFATGLAGPTDLRVGPDGSLYYLNRNAWVKDAKFQPGTGTLHRVSYTANAGRPAPVVTAQSEERIGALGQPVTFRVAAQGRGTLAYQWQRDGTPIPNALESSYTFPRVTTADAGARFRCVVSNEFGSTKSRAAALWVERLRPPVHGASSPFVPGVEYAAYTGSWAGLPDFGTLTPAATGSAPAFDLAIRPRDAHFGLVWSGSLAVAADGMYTFALRASGAGKLFVAGAEVADSRAGREATGAVGLRAGKHPMLLLFAHGAGQPFLELRYAGPDVSWQPIPAAALVRSADDRGGKAASRHVAGSSGTASPKAHRELATTLNMPPDPARLPPLLSEAGVFRSLAELAPNPGVVPYEVNSPQWSDGASKRRWIALRGDARIDVSAAAEWRFPAGTVLIEVIELPAQKGRPPRRLETRLLVVDRSGGGYGATYKWRADGREADLLTDGLNEDIPVRSSAGLPSRQWIYPSRNDCMVCHTAGAGFLLGVSARQLNRPGPYPDAAGVTNNGHGTDNQLRTWSRLGLFTEPLTEESIARTPRLVPVGDMTAPLEQRVRSYLDVNCAHCHRPGGTRSEFDVRFETALPRQKLINAPALSENLGVRDVKLVTPGDPTRSMLFLRMMRRGDVFAMPPVAAAEIDPVALGAVAAWIQGMPYSPPTFSPKRPVIDRHERPRH